MDRPAELAEELSKEGLCTVDTLLKWTTEQYEKTNNISVGVVVLLYPTAPLRDYHTIDAAINKVVIDGFDSCLSLCYDTRYLWRKDGDIVKATNYNPNKRQPRQQEEWNQWYEDKSVYVVKKDVLFSVGRIGEKCGYVEVEKWRSIDVDEPVDLEIARALYKDMIGEETKPRHTNKARPCCTNGHKYPDGRSAVTEQNMDCCELCGWDKWV